ncbi:MAG: TMEM175 family protein [Planctomycetota bacterium]|jgi:uncharacterized membrane protein
MQTGSATGRLSTDRLKAFADGLFAIVVTILVLELEVPSLHDFQAEGLGGFLGKLEHQVRPYVASFAIAAAYWLVHSVILHCADAGNRAFIWLNILFFLPVTVVPYVTAMRADYPGEVNVAVLFGAVQVICNALLLWLWHYVIGHLREAPVDPAVVRSMNLRIFAAIGINVVAVAAVPWSERLATLIFLSMPLLFLSHRRVDGGLAEQAAA